MGTYKFRSARASVCLSLILGAPLAGCTPTIGPAGLTQVQGQVAIVVPLCGGDALSALYVAQLDGTQKSNTAPASYWSIRATQPRVDRLIVVGTLPTGFVAVVPYRRVPSDVQTLVTVSIRQPGTDSPLLRDNTDAFGQAKDGVVLARGHYYSPAEFQSKFGTCRN